MMRITNSSDNNKIQRMPEKITYLKRWRIIYKSVIVNLLMFNFLNCILTFVVSYLGSSVYTFLMQWNNYVWAFKDILNLNLSWMILCYPFAMKFIMYVHNLKFG